MVTAAIGFLVAFLLIFARIPVAISLALVGFLGTLQMMAFKPAVTMLALTVSENTLNYSLSVIPLFVLMGNLVAGSGISRDLYRAAQALIGSFRGGLGMATIVSSGGFAAVSGSSVATAITIGKIAIPSMRSYGYSESLSTATVAAGATLGILIPPSVIMVVYGVQTETSIGHLFAAGLIPGVLGMIGYAIAVRWTTWRNPDAAPPAERTTWKEKFTAVRSTWLVVLLFGVVLGGIYAGLFTPTEAGGIGAAGGLIVALFRRVTLKQLADILAESVITSAMLFALVIGASVFAEFINLTGADRGVLALIQTYGVSPTMTLILILLIYLVLGCVLESLAMMLLTLPIFLPIVVGLGYDPVWFGIVIVMAVELALITPPIGMNLFVVRAVFPDVSLGTIISGILPFVIIDLVRVGLLIAFPAIALWLPNLLYG